MGFMKEDNLKSKLFLMVGVPASGKSTYAKNLTTKEDAIYVSRDEIRFSKIKEGDEYFSKEKEVFGEFINRVQSAINDGKNVIADATHINRASRGKTLRHLNLEGVEVIAVYINTPFDKCLERNSKREGRTRVPEDSMKSMMRYLSTPSLSEGFNRIEEVI